MKLYVMVSKGNLVGIDDNSGGYPWDAQPVVNPRSLHGVQFWNECQIDEANKYMSHWAGKGDFFGDIHLEEFSFNVKRV